MVLPPADAILNPKQYDCPYPNKNLCGAVVAFKYIAALYERFGVPAEELEDYYELAAIATVGDVMDLQGENRILVKDQCQWQTGYSCSFSCTSQCKNKGRSSKACRRSYSS